MTTIRSVRACRQKGAWCDYKVVMPHDAKNKSNMAVKIAKRITSKYNQHITIIMVGGTGTGKSWAAMDLAYRAAREVAKIDLGAEALPNSWQEYFNVDHMAIITLERVTELLKNVRPHGIYVLDDIGVGYNNRDWMKDKNKKMNQIIQTFRTDNTCVIYTVPSRNLIDKVPREMVEWYFEFDRSEQVFSQGLNACKFLDITNLKRENKQLFIYDIVHSAEGSDQFVRHVANKPPAVLTDPYEVLRLEIAQKLREENAAEIAGGGEGDDVTELAAVTPSQMKSIHHYIDVNERRKGGMSIGDACAKVGFNVATYRELRNGRTNWFNEYMAAAEIPLTP